ncbi:MAG TPA: hypothetical protein IAB62_03780 [Candidatus Coprocola pullicola]|nr:hypothetical protein [Candidatus Coprocola pullicola]
MLYCITKQCQYQKTHHNLYSSYQKEKYSHRNIL